MHLTEQFFDAINMLAGTRKNSQRAGKSAPRKAVENLTIEHPELGKVTLAISRRAKRITLTVKPDCTIRLCVPYGTPVDNGLKFLELKKEWALKTLSKYRSRTQTILPPFRTRMHELEVAGGSGEKVTVRISDCRIKVSHPDTMLPESDTVQQAIRKGICEAMRYEAKQVLPGRLAHISQTTGLKYRSVSVRNTVSKWGSCSARNDISLSLHLMRLPDYLIDYILLHELCHTIHKNHGPQFHQLLDKLTDGRHPELRKELKAYHTR